MLAEYEVALRRAKCEALWGSYNTSRNNQILKNFVQRTMYQDWSLERLDDNHTITDEGALKLSLERHFHGCKSPTTRTEHSVTGILLPSREDLEMASEIVRVYWFNWLLVSSVLPTGVKLLEGF